LRRYARTPNLYPNYDNSYDSSYYNSTGYIDPIYLTQPVIINQVPVYKNTEENSE
jgi:hypothetical protein